MQDNTPNMPRNYAFSEVEPKILNYWEEHSIYKKAKDKNSGKKRFYFLDGPPYTSGRVHIGTAWNKSLKDIVLRYKRMRGYDVWDRAGYDMHGMPTEQATMKELKIGHKDEIVKMGVEKFVKACRDLSIRNMNLMTRDFKRLGVWMDFSDPYMPVTKEYIEGEWWLIKKAHENNRLYEGEKTMTWCANCGTSLAKHELEYHNVKDDSIFLKFRVEGKKDEYLIIWTTTPWTIPFNLGVMVNPELDYIKAKVGDEIWVVAKWLAGGLIHFVANRSFEVLEEFKGEALNGIRYVHPLEDELKGKFSELRKRSEKIHTVVLSSEYVNLSAGSGLVHMAPGCGPEDYEVGHREGIPPFNELSESGVFGSDMGVFSGWRAKTDDKMFIEYFDKKGVLIASTPVEHDYAHCWRCKKPVVFRTTTQWFFRIEDLKEKMRTLNKKIYWVPDSAGSRNFDSWLDNLRDNGITRQRFWGTPLPVWKCDSCGAYDVIGSLSELEKKAGKLPSDLHKPWIDEVSYRCSCGSEKKRIADILDVWIDAGSASWNCLNFPQKEELFKEMFPADFILEGIDQIRGWFNLLFVASMVSMQKPSFKSVYMHGFVQDSQGRKMSKSLGNYILPEEVIGKYGADTLRYYMVSGTNPGVDINYNFDDMKIKHKNLGVLWNLAKFMIDLSATNRIRPKDPNPEDFSLEERYIISKMNSLVKKQTEILDSYLLNQAPDLPEELYLELSRTYIQLVREKSSVGTDKEKQLVLDVIFRVFFNALRIFSPVCPMITEEIYLNLKEHFGLKEESIHLMQWPEYDEKMIDKGLESDFEVAKDSIQTILSGREKVQLGQRWPLLEVIFLPASPDIRKSIKATADIIRIQTNVKRISVADKQPAASDDLVEFEFRHGKVWLNRARTAELDNEGYSREIMRRIQVMRRKAGLRKEDSIRLSICAEKDLAEGISAWKEDIKAKVGADELLLESSDVGPEKMFSTSSEEKIKGKKIVLSFERLE
ncbi:isoleucine--tRNA ligase [Candidatus Woesearchaeota archaeon]|nr:isoleucine--tRNA ligase [Candidatus Woesearchaeota archaeon]